MWTPPKRWTNLRVLGVEKTSPSIWMYLKDFGCLGNVGSSETRGKSETSTTWEPVGCGGKMGKGWKTLRLRFDSCFMFGWWRKTSRRCLIIICCKILQIIMENFYTQIFLNVRVMMIYNVLTTLIHHQIYGWWVGEVERWSGCWNGLRGGNEWTDDRQIFSSNIS